MAEGLEVCKMQTDMNTITANLNTKSDKIRALSEAGYSRSEIAKYLNIRYQHVRKVLVDSGIHLSPKKIAPVVKKITLKAHELINNGFNKIADWHLENDKIILSEKLPKQAGVYAFVKNNDVVYIGMTIRSLHQRLNFYSKPGPTQRTSIRVGGLIKNELENNFNIEILAAFPEETRWNGLPVDVVSGLEAALISKYKPAWNMRGA